MIPKIAYFIWLGSELPAQGQQNIDRFKELHPDWEVRVYLNIPAEFPAEARKGLESLSPIKQSEVLRTWLLAEIGGFYLDCDMLPLRSFNEILHYPNIIARKEHGRRTTGCVVGAQPGGRLYPKIWRDLRVLLSNPGGVTDQEIQNRLGLIRTNPWMLPAPEHYFCIFRVKTNAAEFALKNQQAQYDEILRMDGRFIDNVDPLAVHLWGLSVTAPIVEPPLVTKVQTFGKAIAKIGTAMMNGQDLTVSAEEKQRRQDICKSCSFFNSAKNTCRKCGCKTRYKTALTTEHCPVGKWIIIGSLFLTKAVLSGFSLLQSTQQLFG